MYIEPYKGLCILLIFSLEKYIKYTSLHRQLTIIYSKMNLDIAPLAVVKTREEILCIKPFQLPVFSLQKVFQKSQPKYYRGRVYRGNEIVKW